MWSALIPSRWRSRRVRADAAPWPTLPVGRRVYAIGDVHGRADLLARLHRTIADDLAESPVAHSLLVHLGDYVDRGPDPRGVLDLLARGEWPTDAAVHLLGNHEELLLRFLDEPALGRAWLEIGGDTTVASYAVSLTPEVPPAQRFEAIAARLGAALPKAHHDFLRACRAHHVEGDYLFVHAGIRPGRPLARQDTRDLLWIRQEFLASRRDHGFLVVHGHNVTETPDRQPNRIGIDTGAYWTGRLTCLVLEADRQRFLGVDG